MSRRKTSYTHHGDVHIVIDIAESHSEWLEWENHPFLLKMFPCEIDDKHQHVEFVIVTDKNMKHSLHKFILYLPLIDPECCK